MDKLKHKEWRKAAKKLRRKKLRQKSAVTREENEKRAEDRLLSSPSYHRWKYEQEQLEKIQEEEEERIRVRNEAVFQRREMEAQILFMKYKVQEEEVQKVKEEKERSIRIEWEAREAREKQEREEKQEKERIEKEKQDEGASVPSNTYLYELDPNKELCPFFTKTATCRFRENCSRNHPRPLLSRTLLAHGMYSHFSLDHTNRDDYDSDVGLEFDERDTKQHFIEFYADVLPEFREHGTVIQFKVCCNHEPHLRGNVYIQYENEREAVNAYRSLHGRWFGGRQVTLEFVNISSWSSAICGLFFQGRCPKGRTCNFLHVFRHPNGEFNSADSDWSEDWRHNNRNNHWSRDRYYRPNRNVERSSSSRSSSRRSDRRSRSKDRSISHRRRSKSSERSKSNGRSSSRRRSKSRERSRKSSRPSTDSRNHKDSVSKKKSSEPSEWRWSQSPEWPTPNDD